ncbi:likely mitochondrial ribosomal protein [Pseudozyma hubeiensis SY62]|uniref:Small ribosomal subunit protein uS9m n=1 Tax=Pseudozyma hubeiensis (strain SY62) TaxID=1305764 RepID=R9P277_PSEHS|nr:likely mitochondrial ribosomal protein [Pseudozyma hubeiensis SY62]GAC95297.1 likely mitochondrial ribosomal protein [Pseudozyma hubeiensis SY62]
MFDRTASSRDAKRKRAASEENDFNSLLNDFHHLHSTTTYHPPLSSEPSLKMALTPGTIATSSKRALTSTLRTLSLTNTVRFASTSTSSSSSSSSYQQSRIPRLPPIAPLPARTKPTSPSYYTGRPAYIDTLLELEELTRQTKRLLEQSHLLPPNSSAPTLTSARQNLWASIGDLQTILGTNLKAAQYRQIVSRLSLLARYATLVKQFESNPALAGGSEMVDKFHTTLERFMNENAKSQNLLAEKDSDRALWLASEKKIDGKGRAYSMGRRKESSAQVWIVRTKSSVGSILINNQPIQEYFTRTAEREAITWPLKLSSTLGAYNVFALCRGGGKSGQAGAVAHALANAIVAETGSSLGMEHGLPVKKYVRDVLAKDGVLKRDPRMVERKKTGMLKARKAFTWVKR